MRSISCWKIKGPSKHQFELWHAFPGYRNDKHQHQHQHDGLGTLASGEPIRTVAFGDEMDRLLPLLSILVRSPYHCSTKMTCNNVIYEEKLSGKNMNDYFIQLFAERKT